MLLSMAKNNGCFVGFCLLLNVLVACRLYGPGVQLENAKPALPATYPQAEPNERFAYLDRYWELFGADELNDLIEAALVHNYDLQAAAGRVREAGLGARVAWSERFPNLSYGANATHTKSGGDAQAKSGWTMDLGVAARYELDLWGRAHALHQSEKARFESTRWDYATAKMTLTAEVALRWIEVRVAIAQLSLLDAQAEAIEQSAELLELRYKQGDAAWTDVLGLRQTSSEIDERRALVEQLREVAMAQLRLFVGGNDDSLHLADTAEMPEVPPLPAPGLPADLLQQRPDVQAAWHRVLVAGWTTASKEAGRLPTLSLGGNFGFASANPHTLFESWIASLVAGLTGPLFDFFGRKYAAEQAAALTEVRLAEFSQTLLEAFRDVEVALAAHRHLSARLAAVRKRAAIARMRAEQLKMRYRNGAANYLDVYLAELARMEAERTELSAQADLLTQRVQLARALGGGWQLHHDEVVP